MRTAEQLDALEKLAFETGLRGDELQAVFNQRLNAPAKPERHGKRYVAFLEWLYRELNECYLDPNRSRPAPRVLPPLPQYAEEILGMPVGEYLA